MIYQPQHFLHFPTSFVLGYVDPGLGYMFQGIGPIIPTILGAVTGAVALFWSHIKAFFINLFSHSSKSDKPNTP